MELSLNARTGVEKEIVDPIAGREIAITTMKVMTVTIFLTPLEHSL
jgi:hypothetical protein